MNLIKSNAALAAGLALVMLGGFGLLVRPAHVSARDLEADIESKRAELSRPGSGPEAIEKLARDLKALRDLGSERMTPIPQESGVAALVKGLSESFDGLGLKDREISTGAAKHLEEGGEVLRARVAAVREFVDETQRRFGDEGLQRHRQWLGRAFSFPRVSPR